MLRTNALSVGHRIALGVALVAGLTFAFGGWAEGADGRPPSHQHKKLFGLTFPHSPAEEEECTTCHALHFPAAPHQLKAPGGKLCAECHDAFTGNTVHKPVAQGNCPACHRPHGSDTQDLLVALGAPLCTGCHKEKKGGVHRQGAVMEGGCQTCHDPHATQSKRLLRGGMGSAQCVLCHAKTVKGKVTHSALATRPCDECHNPHINPPKATVSCLLCHGRITAGKVVHEPVKEGCSSCHGTHAAPERGMLLAPVPALCLDCHDDKKGGRHGNRSFARPCTECHSPHSSDAKGMLRGAMDKSGCPTCHGDILEGKAVVHTPAREGDCSDCHNPHAVPPVPTVPCTDCHDDIMAGKFVHDPARGGCGNCHDPHASANRFQLTSPVPRLCISCHGAMAGGKHGKIKLGEDCTRCHAAHTASQPKLLVLAISSTPCGECHHFLKEGAVVHRPVAADDCRACHDPHANPPVKSVPCTECHDKVMYGEYKHEPAAESCLECHFAHSGPDAKLLTETVPALCTGCHEENEEGRHGKAQMSTACLDCHQPHSGANPKLVKNMEGRRCESCHVGTREGKFVHTALAKYACKDCHDPHSDPPEMPPLSCNQCHASLIDKRPSHGSAVQGKCLLCHDPHSGDNRNLVKPLADTSNSSCLGCHEDIRRSLERGASRHRPLEKGLCVECHTLHAGTPPYTKKAFASDLQVPFTRAAYSLCWACHEPNLVQVEYTETDTRFRNGVQNLHFLHVVRDRVKGFSCWACHDSHAGYQRKLVNDTAPFQPKYNLKITFTMDENGGSCFSNCHSVKGYRR